MKALRRGLLVLPLAFSHTLAAGPCHATSDGPDRFRVRDVRADDTLAMRVQPNAGARIIAALPPNVRGIENLGCVDGKTGQSPADTRPANTQLWCKIRLGSLTGWAAARFLREDPEVLKPYSVSNASSGPGQFTATSTAIEKTTQGDGRWRVMTQTVISGSTSTDIPNEVTVHSELIDCRRGRSEVIRLGGDNPGYSTAIQDVPGSDYKPALSNFDEYNLWWSTCRDIQQRYRWQ